MTADKDSTAERDSPAERESTAETETGDQRVVAIDGPSGSGKSTVSRALATRLGFRYLDTGAMYRAITFHLHGRGLYEAVAGGLAESELQTVLDDVRLEITDAGRVWVNGRDVTDDLRTQDVEARVSRVSALPALRRMMRRLQRGIAAAGPLVAEGRDMASVVFPRARWKFFLDADPAERARRRWAEFRARGRQVDLELVLAEIETRDHLDCTRADAPLVRALDATRVDTTGLSLPQVIETLEARVKDSG